VHYTDLRTFSPSVAASRQNLFNSCIWLIRLASRVFFLRFFWKRTFGDKCHGLTVCCLPFLPLNHQCENIGRNWKHWPYIGEIIVFLPPLECRGKGVAPRRRYTLKLTTPKLNLLWRIFLSNLNSVLASEISRQTVHRLTEVVRGAVCAAWLLTGKRLTRRHVLYTVSQKRLTFDLP